MKRIGLLTGVVVAVMLGAGVDGFGGQEQMEHAIRLTGEVRTYGADARTSMGMTMTVMGQEINMDMTTQSTTEWMREPLRTKVEMTTTVMGQSSHGISYAEKQGDDYVSYAKPEGQDWVKMTLKGDAFPSGTWDLGQFLELVADFEENGTETVGGAEATVYAGALTAEKFKGIMNLGQLVSSIGASLGMDASKMNLDDYGAIPMTVLIDNTTDLPVKITSDLTGFMKKVAPAIIQGVCDSIRARMGTEDIEPEALGFGVDFTEVRAETFYRDFDAVEPFEIPEEALGAKPFDLFDSEEGTLEASGEEASGEE